MRITGGTLSGRNVICPPGIIRPAMDRMRESFFSILGELNGLSFLDLFSGSGLMGIEAFSRGAYPVRCVEKDQGKRELLGKNISMADRRIDLSLMPVERFIKAWRESYDLVFLDPPFDYPFKGQLLSRLLDSKILRTGSRVFIHYPEEDKLPETILPESGAHGEKRLILADKRVYGRSIVHFYGLEENATQ